MEHLNPTWVAESYPIATPTPPLLPNRLFLQSLKPGDCILGSREILTVTSGILYPNRIRWLARVKRPLQKLPIVIRDCLEFPSCVEIRYTFNEGYKCIEIDTLTVIPF